MAEANVAGLNEQLVALGIEYQIVRDEMNHREFIMGETPEETLKNIGSILVILQDAVLGVEDYCPHRKHGQHLILLALESAAMEHARHLDGVQERMREVYQARRKRLECDREEKHVSDSEMVEIYQEFSRKAKKLARAHKRKEEADA